MGRPKPGHEEEWQRLMQPLYEEREESDEAEERRLEISEPAYATAGAPRVGYSEEANAWYREHYKKPEGLTDAEFIERAKGYYVLDLVVGKCDGVPVYSHGDLYDGVDKTSFRGKFLEVCEGLLEDDILLYRAWTSVMPPEEAVEYGQALLASAENPWVEPTPPPPPPPSPPPPPPPELGFLDRLLGRKPPESKPPEPEPPEPPPTEEDVEEMRNILRAAGRWYIFWGERGHPINAWW
ncbi:MAG: hypothetical protein OXF89_18805 [Rhodospirillaceae bacterium]|nr:hypothetical protein [Rhodospirillaceae bacterium]